MLFIDKQCMVAISDQSLDDLNMTELVMRLDNIATPEDAKNFLHAYLCSDKGEIARRNAAVKALLQDPDSKNVMAQMLKDARQMSENAKNLFDKNTKLSYCIYALRMFKLYVNSVSALYDYLSRLNNPVLKDDVEYVGQLKSSENFKAVVKALDEIDAFFEGLRNIDIGVNVSNIGDPEAFGIIGYNNKTEIDRDIFTVKDGETGAVVQSIYYDRNGPLLRLEAYFRHRFEKQHSSVISRTIRLLRSLDYAQVSQWSEHLTSLEFYFAAIDFYQKLSKKGYSLCEPDFTSNGFSAEGMVYPHLALTVDEKIIPSATGFAKGEVVIITGANHSGKTSFLRATAQNMLLGHMGFMVPAKSFSSPVYGRMYTLFSSGEDNGSNLSRFQLELDTIKNIFEQCDGGTFVFMNEPFTSTSPNEACEILCDVCTRLSKKKVTQFIVTHFSDVYDMLKANKELDLVSFITLSEMKDGVLTHHYVIKKSEPKPKSYAQAIAAQFGVSAGHIIKDREKCDLVQAYLEREDE